LNNFRWVENTLKSNINTVL